MIYRSLDNDGDMVIGKGGAGFKTGSEAVAQAVKTRLRLLRGEWWADLTEGLPLFQRILGRRDLEEARRAVKERIASTPGVIAVSSLEVTMDGRRLEIKGTVTTEYGTTTITEALA
jgi:hypothetical protein